MKVNRGFTLIECILALTLFSLVLYTAMSLYLLGYRVYRKQENRVELEQNARVVLNRISETLRRSNRSTDTLSVSGNTLIIGNTRYYQLGNGVLERINSGTNTLGEKILLFKPSLNDGYLTIQIETMANQEEDSFFLEQVFYTGGD